MPEKLLKIRKFKNEKAITLIVLVVTIVILLILAGVTITMTLGQNGLFTKAKEGKESYDEASVREDFSMLMTQYTWDKAAEKTNKNITEYLKENEILYDIDEENDKVIANYKGYDISISKETNEIQNIEKSSGKESISLVENITPNNYGDDLKGYNVNGISEWKIFYKDNNNVYLIASDFANIAKICEENLRFTNGNNYRIRAGSFTDIYTDETTTKGKFEKALNDKEIWSKYYTNDLAEYAIASPTLEMLIKSYNQKYNLNMSCEYDSNGYVIQYNANNNKIVKESFENCIILDLAKRDIGNRSFDYFMYAIIMYQLEEHNKSLLISEGLNNQY